MQSKNIAIAGISLRVESETYWVASSVPLQVLSSFSVIGGDLQEARHILSARVPTDPDKRDFALQRPHGPT